MSWCRRGLQSYFPFPLRGLCFFRLSTVAVLALLKSLLTERRFGARQAERFLAIPPIGLAHGAVGA